MNNKRLIILCDLRSFSTVFQEVELQSYVCQHPLILREMKEVDTLQAFNFDIEHKEIKEDLIRSLKAKFPSEKKAITLFEDHLNLIKLFYLKCVEVDKDSEDRLMITENGEVILPAPFSIKDLKLNLTPNYLKL